MDDNQQHARMPGFPDPAPARVQNIPEVPESWGWVHAEQVGVDQFGLLWASALAVPWPAAQYVMGPHVIVAWSPEGLALHLPTRDVRSKLKTIYRPADDEGPVPEKIEVRDMELRYTTGESSKNVPWIPIRALLSFPPPKATIEVDQMRLKAGESLTVDD